MMISLQIQYGKRLERRLSIFGAGVDRDFQDGNRYWLSLGPLSVSLGFHLRWLRLGRRIVWFRDRKVEGLTFGQRNGLTKWWSIGRWAVSFERLPKLPDLDAEDKLFRKEQEERASRCLDFLAAEGQRLGLDDDKTNPLDKNDKVNYPFCISMPDVPQGAVAFCSDVCNRLKHLDKDFPDPKMVHDKESVILDWLEGDLRLTMTVHAHGEHTWAFRSLRSGPIAAKSKTSEPVADAFFGYAKVLMDEYHVWFPL